MTATIAARECSLAALVLVLLFPTCAQVEKASNDEKALKEDVARFIQAKCGAFSAVVSLLSPGRW